MRLLGLATLLALQAAGAEDPTEVAFETEDFEVGAAKEPKQEQQWVSLDEIEEDHENFLGCMDDGDPRSIVAYCVSTRPAESDCILEADAPEGSAGSIEYLEWRKGCLHRCLFGTPDLNMADVSDEAIAMASPMSAAAYKAAPFLDMRSLVYGLESCRYVAPILQLQELATWGTERGLPVGGRPVGEGVHFIFHLGHAGSTLLSRALGEVEDTLVLREPPLLSWMATTFASAGAKQLQGLWKSPLLPFLSRRASPEQTVLVKAKSVALRFLRPALRLTPSARAVFMYSGLRTHLTVCLAREEDRFPDEQYEALEMRGSLFSGFSAKSSAFKDLSVPKRMALAWLKRMLFVKFLPKRRVLLLNMQDFLSDPISHLVEVAAFFGLPLERRAASAIADDERIFGVYSKDENVEWGVTMQKRLMEGRALAFQEGIEEGVRFATKLLAKHKGLRRLEALIGT